MTTLLAAPSSSGSDRGRRKPSEVETTPLPTRRREPASRHQLENWFAFLFSMVLDQKQPTGIILRYQEECLSVEFQGLSEEDGLTQLMQLRVPEFNHVLQRLNAVESFTALNKEGELRPDRDGETVCTYTNAVGIKFTGRAVKTSANGRRNLMLTLIREAPVISKRR